RAISANRMVYTIYIRARESQDGLPLHFRKPFPTSALIPSCHCGGPHEGRTQGPGVLGRPERRDAGPRIACVCRAPGLGHRGGQGRSLVDCLNNIRTLEDRGIRFIAVTQSLDTDVKNPASRLLLRVLGAAAEFERALIRERTQAGRLRYQQDYDAGRVGKGVYSWSGRNLPPYRPRRIFDREQVVALRQQGFSLRQIARKLGLGLGTVTRTLQPRSKTS